jgi:hypothetical protein
MGLFSNFIKDDKDKYFGSYFTNEELEYYKKKLYNKELIIVYANYIENHYNPEVLANYDLNDLLNTDYVLYYMGIKNISNVYAKYEKSKYIANGWGKVKELLEKPDFKNMVELYGIYMYDIDVYVDMIIKMLINVGYITNENDIKNIILQAYNDYIIDYIIAMNQSTYNQHQPAYKQTNKYSNMNLKLHPKDHRSFFTEIKSKQTTDPKRKLTRMISVAGQLGFSDITTDNEVDVIQTKTRIYTDKELSKKINKYNSVFIT